ncbi:MAG: DEAD/DEAH box helicase [Planctomycetes bacterium]|nr:DEAD/DEAH box helicase [Planctomycetota bacterium]
MTTTEILFRDLALPEPILRALTELGYEQPTPIQASAIPPLLEGRDLVGQAQTGTGKTAAFALPLLAKIELEQRKVQAIVLTPTRELALQVAEATRAYGRHLGQRGVSVLPVYGGQAMPIQMKALASGVHVVIGTPGRVKDHLERGTLSLAAVRFFGLDEADEMLNMGFLEDVEWILAQAPAERQVALFSATMPAPIRRIASQYLRNPVDLAMSPRALTVPAIEQFGMRVERHEKNEALERILEAEEYEAVLVFAGTQVATTELAERLQAHGYSADCIHGGITQAQREVVVKRLKAKKLDILVATDVAARGLDVDHIGLVINYDLPRDVEVYVHRIGRTGRAGRAGRAISLLLPRDRGMFHAIERFTGRPLELVRIPGRAEIVDRQRERLQERVRAHLEGELEEFKNLVRTMQTEEELDPIDLAAAALRELWGEAPLYVAPDPEPARAGAPRRVGDDDFVEILIPVGTWNRATPGALVGAIAGESGIPGSSIGRIKIHDKVSFIGIPSEQVSRVLQALKGKRVCGRVIYARLASEAR